MTARIYCLPKSATQSGFAKMGDWIFEFVSDTERRIDPLMGWTSSSDMNAQVRLVFASRDEAVDYAERRAIPYVIVPTSKPARRLMAYADNFRHNRIGLWTH